MRYEFKMTKFKIKIQLIKYIIVFVSVLVVGSYMLLGCGVTPGHSGVFSSRLGETTGGNRRQEASGVFNTRSGRRLDSPDSCFKEEECQELCDSMLEKLSDQKECYTYTQKEVQAFRDTYNLLALGVRKKLDQITPAELEDFLEFGEVLWLNAITGFERGLKDGCSQGRKCRDEDYYLQRGYDRSGAANALSWIALNNWVAEKIATYDKDEAIMQKLIEYLHQPVPPDGIESASRDKIRNDYPSTTCERDIKAIDAHNILKKTTPAIVIVLPCLRGDKNYHELSKGNDKSRKLESNTISDMCKSASCTLALIDFTSSVLCTELKKEDGCEAVGGTWNSGSSSCNIITQSFCIAVGGSWNSGTCTCP